MKRKESLKLNNDGITLIEIIVVVAIIGIMATALVVSMSSIFGRNAYNAATKLADMMDSARVEAMNRVDGNVYLHLSQDSNGDYIAEIKLKKDDGTASTLSQEVIGNGGLTVQIMTMADEDNEEETVHSTISNLVSWDFYFKKSTGAFKKETEAKPKTSGVLISSSKKAEVVTVWETGRSYVISVE